MTPPDKTQGAGNPRTRRGKPGSAPNTNSKPKPKPKSKPKSKPKPKHDSQNKPTRFPDYILCGSLNLHRSPENAASLAHYIAKQWDFLRLNNDGIISSAQLEINRDPEGHGGLRDGKPLTVTEWNKIQEGKLLEKRKQLAAQEVAAANTDTNGASVSNASVHGQNPSSTSRGRGRGRSRSR